MIAMATPTFAPPSGGERRSIRLFTFVSTCSTVVVVVALLPELFTSSAQGRFVGALALAFIFAVLA
jgi:uncharacterized membrane protein